MRVVRDGELLEVCVTLDGDGTARNMSKWRKIM